MILITNIVLSVEHASRTKRMRERRTKSRRIIRNKRLVLALRVASVTGAAEERIIESGWIAVLSLAIAVPDP